MNRDWMENQVLYYSEKLGKEIPEDRYGESRVFCSKSFRNILIIGKFTSLTSKTNVESAIARTSNLRIR